jgi:hypothetical protein
VQTVLALVALLCHRSDVTRRLLTAVALRGLFLVVWAAAFAGAHALAVLVQLWAERPRGEHADSGESGTEPQLLGAHGFLLSISLV